MLLSDIRIHFFLVRGIFLALSAADPALTGVSYSFPLITSSS